jgi:hypothetical protein
MKHHPDDTKTHECACPLLAARPWRLLPSPEKSRKVGTCELVVRAECFPILVACLEHSIENNHPGNIFFILGCIGEQMEDSPCRLSEAGGFQATLSVMRQWKDIDSIQWLSCGVLSAVHFSQEHERPPVSKLAESRSFSRGSRYSSSRVTNT